jgi:glycyl-tRNA synthetase beta chain
MANYLLEIGTEELPADFVPEAQERLRNLLSEALESANLSFEGMDCMGTPRRIACVVKGLSAVQPTMQKKVKGPPVKSSFDAQGNPLPPAIGFAQKQGIDVKELAQEEIGGINYTVANLTITGRPAPQVLSDLMPKVIEQISGERLMRWGSGDFKFSRPIRWIVSLFDKEEVPVNIDGLRSSRLSMGHRILSPGTVEIRGPETYVDDLRKAHVLVDPEERRKVIEAGVAKAADEVSGRAKQIHGSLLEEVINITEWPHAVRGEFEHEYLALPDTLIETVMVHHQRYFPVERTSDAQNSRQKLLPYFVTIANTHRPESEAQIKRGNERVLRARLSDGKFFYFDDQRTKLSERNESLAQLTWVKGLGSYLDKQQRLVELGRAFSEKLGLEPKYSIPLERALELCKLDLVTNLVRELPELQGYVGSWYAELEGQPPEVVAAIASHYSPRSTDDQIPGDIVGRMASLVDKLDTLVSLFSIGNKPSGSSDPYVLRRQAQGAIDIMMDGLPDHPLDVSWFMAEVVKRLQLDEKTDPKIKDKFNPSTGVSDLRDFLLQRVKTKLMERGFRREVVDAVTAAGDPFKNIPDAIIRCDELEKLLSAPGGTDTTRAGVRIGNILTGESKAKVDPSKFSEVAEKELWNTFSKDVAQPWTNGGDFKEPTGHAEYERLLSLLNKIAPAVDLFFDKVMVNDPDVQKRDNRHALLSEIDKYYKSVADFTKLQPLLG